VSFFKKAIEIDPESDIFFDNLAHAYAGLQQYDRAIASVKKAISLNPGDDDYQTHLEELVAH
ncbi:MAG: tetratricopeptide repeat protein, partial [Calditrichaeota bacterium]|nr:tetratricopeptide repeat protein [Calditrichota bacterium]